MVDLITTIAGGDAGSIVRRARAALAGGADLVELRLDTVTITGDALGAILLELPRGRWVVTFRSVSEGGQSDLTFDKKANYRSVARRFPDWKVDVELAELTEEGVDSGELLGIAAKQPGTCILSAHDFSGRPADVGTLVSRMRAASADGVAKVAWQAADIGDNFDALELMRSGGGRTVAIAMGEKGLMSRVLAAKVGGWGSFCAPTESEAAAPGQTSLPAMVGSFGWHRQTTDTAVYGVIGSPVAHSMSPALFNRLFVEHGIDAVYLPLRIDDRDELHAFLDGCRRRPWLNVGGFSVTVPHKSAALAWVGSERAEPLAGRIGAANTLKFEADGLVTAHNTDYAGALAALLDGLGVGEGELPGLSVAVLGAGGVARAVVAGLRDRGAPVTIYNRTASRAAALADAFGAQSAPWDARAAIRADAVINCTSIGMAPHSEATPLPADALGHRPAVFDTVYNPLQTRLLREAEQAGCRTIDGVAMFVRQAAAQFRLWTGIEPDLERMRREVGGRLAARHDGVEGDGR